jgi:hypothetical protein
VSEIIELETRGFIESGSSIRKINEKVCEITKQDYSTNLFLTQTNILKKRLLDGMILF